MSIKETKEIDRFMAKTDSGVEYTIICSQDYIDASTHDDPNSTIPGKKRMRTSDGRIVTYIDSETFKIVETDEIIRKI